MTRATKLVGMIAVLVLVAAACTTDDGEVTPTEGPVLIGADGLLSDTYVTLPETEGMYFSGPALSDVAGYNAFLPKYEEKAGTGPIQSFHAHAYDATNLLLAALQADGVAEVADDGTVTISRQALRDALYAIDGFQGLTGSLSCNEFGDCAQPAISVYENVDPVDSIGGVFANVRYTSRPEGAAEKTGPDPREGADATDRTITIAPGDPIKIASLQAISGAVASLGTDQVTAIDVAIDDAGGELFGHPIQQDPQEDDLCSAEGGEAGAQRIVSDDQIVGVIGTSCSGAAASAMPILERRGYSMVSGSNTSPGLTATGYLAEGDLEVGENWRYGFFRTAHNDEFQGQGSAQFVFENLGLRTAATIHDGDPYTEGLVTQFRDFFEALGGEVVVFTSINKGDTDMRPVLTEIQQADPEAIYFPIFQPEGDFIVRQALEIFGE